MMKKILGIAAIIMMIWVSAAAEIWFSPDSWNIGKWCIVATDVVIDTNNQEIAATDVVIESSMEFVDFVPTWLFPYFLPPKITSGNIVHLVWFATDATNRVNGSWSIGTLYMKQKDTTSIDGSLKLYFTQKWDTTDSNLSIAWWTDALDTIHNAYYTFVDTGICEHSVADINGWIADISLQDITKQINRDHGIGNIFTRTTLFIVGGVILLSWFLFVYYKRRNRWKAN